MTTLDNLFGPDNGRCNAVALSCICDLPVHDDVEIPHRCHGHADGGPRCKSMWRGHWDDGTFTVVRFPGGGTPT